MTLFCVEIDRGLVLNMPFYHLLKMCKMSRNKKEYAGAVLIGVSKAFDAINEELSIAKLLTYGFSKNALKLLLRYICDRW